MQIGLITASQVINFILPSFRASIVNGCRLLGLTSDMLNQIAWGMLVVKNLHVSKHLSRIFMNVKA